MTDPRACRPSSSKGERSIIDLISLGSASRSIEALHGQHPFDEASLTSPRSSVLSGPLRPPPKRSPVPVWIHRLLVRGVALLDAPALPAGWYATVGVRGPWVWFTQDGNAEA